MRPSATGSHPRRIPICGITQSESQVSRTIWMPATLIGPVRRGRRLLTGLTCRGWRTQLGSRLEELPRLTLWPACPGLPSCTRFVYDARLFCSDLSCHLGGNLTVTLLMSHARQLTHTVTGRWAADVPTNQCYKWRCAAGGRAHGTNAETVAFLGLTVWASTQGYGFSSNGDLTKA